MAMSGGKDDGAPMMEMNMTPLIDVLLVLLIMFIITIPLATNAVTIDIGVGEGGDVDPVINKIVVGAALLLRRGAHAQISSELERAGPRVLLDLLLPLRE